MERDLIRTRTAQGRSRATSLTARGGDSRAWLGVARTGVTGWPGPLSAPGERRPKHSEGGRVEAAHCPVAGRAVRGKFCGRTSEEIGRNDFVLAGLVPWAFSPRTGSVGIHGFEQPKQRRGCADQVRARRLGDHMGDNNLLFLQGRFPRTALRRGGRFPLLGRNCNCNLFRLKQKIFRENYFGFEGRTPLCRRFGTRRRSCRLIGDKDAKVLATAHGAVGLDYCWAGDGSASDDNYSQHHLSAIDYGTCGAEHGGGAEDRHRSTSTVRLRANKMLPGVSDSDATKIVQGRPYSDKSQLVSKKVVSEPTYDENQRPRGRQAIEVVRRQQSAAVWQGRGLLAATLPAVQPDCAAARPRCCSSAAIAGSRPRNAR